MKIHRLLVPLAFLFVAACGGNQSSEMPAHDEAMHESMEEMPYEGPNAELIAELDASAELLMSKLDGLTEEQYAYQESPERWSIIGVVEHLVKSEDALRGMLADSVLSGEPMMETAEGAGDADMAVRAMMADRSNSIQTIPPLEPTGMFASLDEAVMAFEASRDETVEFLKSTDKDLRAYSRALDEGMPTMDGAQWVIFIASHVNRHCAQIDQVKAHEGYPVAAAM